MHAYFARVFLSILLTVQVVYGSSFTFELPDKESRCFYNFLAKGSSFRIEFQVISGGNYDVDVIMKNPNSHIEKQFQREQYNFFEIKDTMEGDYELCFSNEFSSFTHKIIFMTWELPGESMEQAGKINTPITLIDQTISAVSDNLKKASSYQTKNRVQEASSRSFVESLNDRVTWGSFIQAVIIVVVAVSQVYLLRSLFKEPTSSYRRRINPTTAVNTAGY